MHTAPWHTGYASGAVTDRNAHVLHTHTHARQKPNRSIRIRCCWTCVVCSTSDCDQLIIMVRLCELWSEATAYIRCTANETHSAQRSAYTHHTEWVHVFHEYIVCSLLAHKTSVFQWFSQRLILSFRRLCGSTVYKRFTHTYIQAQSGSKRCASIFGRSFIGFCVLFCFIISSYNVIHRRDRTHTRATILLLLLFVIRQSVFLWCKMYAPVRWLREWVNQFQSPFVCVSVDVIVCVPKQKAIFWLLQLLLRNEQTTERNERKEEKNRGFFFLSLFRLSIFLGDLKKWSYQKVIYFL